ncbi:hypothetical protein PPL_11600 [Heterostelium album PN500]|uniref:Uncharacterized protein n=1 Tax=Heterostelium pallidum (strain ATCC 26659 / Pp 5 / PN500) TaxID=670386 RepID=D3BV75_HETP5|nr:hypothetical protein PPL_11600 [Heterostelium album PN500]EFA74632.1 hypothetical protein PPL_11600 [Heterostelium album PN500]|eukprot:XP_020426766.1 hypothetical protein PPL_11600 [Heterostelium album PN500]
MIRDGAEEKDGNHQHHHGRAESAAAELQNRFEFQLD